MVVKCGTIKITNNFIESMYHLLFHNTDHVLTPDSTIEIEFDDKFTQSFVLTNANTDAIGNLNTNTQLQSAATPVCLEPLCKHHPLFKCLRNSKVNVVYQVPVPKQIQFEDIEGFEYKQQDVLAIGQVHTLDPRIMYFLFVYDTDFITQDKAIKLIQQYFHFQKN